MVMTASTPALDVTDRFSYHGYTYRVTAFYKKVQMPAVKPEQRVLWALAAMGADPDAVRYRYYTCPASEAMFVGGAGIGGCIAPIAEVQPLGPIGWPEPVVAEHREAAARRHGEQCYDIEPQPRPDLEGIEIDGDDESTEAEQAHEAYMQVLFASATRG